MGRYELTDGEWKAIEPHLPNKPRGVPRSTTGRLKFLTQFEKWFLASLRLGASPLSLVHVVRPDLRAVQDAQNSTLSAVTR